MKHRPQALRKAAILIASLDSETADSLLAQMSPEQAKAVGEAMADLGAIDPAEQQTVIEDFFRIGPLVPGPSPTGIELDSQAARQWNVAGGKPSAAPWNATSGGALRSPPFRFLHDASSEALARYLEREHPQTVAVVVSHLSRQCAAEVLGSLSPELQGEVALRLAHLDDTDPEILGEIERGMQSWFAEQSRNAAARPAGLETLRGILSAAGQGAKHDILRNLARRDRRLASKLGDPPRRTMSFAELERCDDLTLSQVLRQAPLEIVQLALAGAGNEFVGRVLRLLPIDQARRLRVQLDNLGPTRLSDVERAQQELASVAARLATVAVPPRHDTKHLSVAV